jgi:SAM-dependent methyltransferase
MEKISFERYIQSFNAFAEYSEEYGYQSKHLLEIGNSELQNGFSVLDIGAGSGFFAKEFLDDCKYYPSNYTAIEPSSEHYKKLDKTFRSSEFEVNLIKEIFTPQTYLNKKFDLILLSHCPYWFIPDPEPYLLNAVKFMKDQGKLIIYLQTPFTASHILNLLFEKDLPVDRVPNHRINSWTIMDILDDNNLQYRVSNLPGTFDATYLFEEKYSNLLVEVISFFLSVEAESFDEKTLKRTKDALKILSYEEKSDLKLNLEVGAITVYK